MTRCCCCSTHTLHHAHSFYAYIGFDVIATSAEETIRPERNIPIGIICSLVVCALSYMGVSAVVTLMVDYSEINTQVQAPLQRPPDPPCCTLQCVSFTAPLSPFQHAGATG